MKRLYGIILLIFTIILSACGTYIEEDSVGLSVHFLDVGQADCALLVSDGEAMLIDGGNREDSSLLYSYLSDLGIEHLEYIIGTHAHEDHMGGLLAALNKATVGKIYIPKLGNDAKFYSDFLEKAEEDEIEIDNPEPIEALELGSCSVTLMTPKNCDEEDINNSSIMARVVCGEKSFLFTGDAEMEEEHDILEQGFDISSTVMKAPHHGSETSSSYSFLREVMPEIIVISVGADNPYSHPHEEVLSRYKDLGATVLRTDENGHIVINTDGKNLSIEPKKEIKKEQPKKSENGIEADYIGNSNSKKLHLPSCANLPNEENRVYFESREDAISMGFEPCKGCNP